MVFSTTMSVKARLGFGLAATLPLLAPYNLLIKPVWADTPSLAWFFFLVVGLGAMAVSVLLFLVAIYGINRRVEFDDTAKVIRVTESHLVQRQRNFTFSFGDFSSRVDAESTRSSLRTMLDQLR